MSFKGHKIDSEEEPIGVGSSIHQLSNFGIDKVKSLKIKLLLWLNFKVGCRKLELIIKLRDFYHL